MSDVLGLQNGCSCCLARIRHSARPEWVGTREPLCDLGLVRHWCVGANRPARTHLNEPGWRERMNYHWVTTVIVLAVGWGDGAAIHQSTAAQPPVILDWLHQCQSRELVASTHCFDYFRLVLEARDVPADHLLAANLRMAAAARLKNTGADFLLRAGRELIRLLAHDPIRLESLLREVQP